MGFRYIDPVSFAVILDKSDSVLVVNPVDLVHQDFERCHVKQTYWIHRAFSKYNVKNSSSCVNCHAFAELAYSCGGC
jgi:hypothetical protein